MTDRGTLIVLPLYAALPTDAQRKVFLKAESLLPRHLQSSAIKRVRKCVVATNIAETSITVPLVRFVVDTGFVKQKTFDPTRGMESLVTVPISKIAALQRAGRAGRTGPGQCYRLYSSECFDNMMDETIPEIQRVNLANTVLYLKALGIRDVLGFDFMDPPSEEQILQALTQLYTLGGIDCYGDITLLGRKMSAFPLEPNLSRAVIESATSECDCLQELLIIAAMLCGENIWYRPKARSEDRAAANKHMREQQLKEKKRQYQMEQQRRLQNPRDRQQQPAHSHYTVGPVRSEEEERAEAAHSALRHPLGDHFTYLHIFQEWEESGFSFQWCETHYINHRSLSTVRKIRDHLASDIDKGSLKDVMRLFRGESNRKEETRDKKQSRLSLEQRISNAITAGYFMNAAVRCANESIYKSLPLGGLEGDVRMVYVHPNSVFVYTKPPEYVVYQDLVHSAKLYMNHIVKTDWKCLQAHQQAWTFVPPQQLSGRKLLKETHQEDEEDSGAADTGAECKEADSKPLKRGREEFEAAKVAGSSTGDGKAAAVELARMRFLARKQQK